VNAEGKLELGQALVSVSDKTGLIEFLKPLAASGLRIVSTGGTKKYLDQNDIETQDVASITQFPEVLDGRVKTLHPHVHMGLLADLSQASHVDALRKHKVSPFSIVVGNLYQYELYRDVDHIDIGGPSFLRASAKNFANVIVLCDPSDYQWVQEKILAGGLSLSDRKQLAMKVFQLTSYYDALIAKQFALDLNQNELEAKFFAIPIKKKQVLRYGENAHQKAVWYEDPMAKNGLSQAKILQGKELSYNNLLDLNAAAQLAGEFSSPACVAVKHNNPCGVGFSNTIENAVKNCIAADPKSIFGGIIAINGVLNLDSAKLLGEIFLECVVAKEFTSEALSFFEKKKNLRLLSWNFGSSLPTELKSIQGGYLMQESDHFTSDQKTSAEENKILIPQAIQHTIERGIKVCGFLKSNAIAILDAERTYGLGMGQVNRVDAVRQAIERAESTGGKENLQNLVLVSDAFFPFPDSIELIAKAGLRWIVQPGGSVKDADVIEAAKKHKIQMVMTGIRHFRH